MISNSHKVAACGCLVTLTAILSGHRLSAGWSWDLLNGFGFAALIGIVFLAFQGRISSQRRAHQLLSYSILGLLSAHALGFLLLDNTLVSYLQPGTPWYMSVGIGAYLLFLLTLVVALPKLRTKAFNGVSGFRRWHRYFGWLLIALSVLHIIGAGYYLRYWYQYLLLAALLFPLAFSDRLQNNTALNATNLVVTVSLLIVTALAVTAALNWASTDLASIGWASPNTVLLDLASVGLT